MSTFIVNDSYTVEDDYDEHYPLTGTKDGNNSTSPWRVKAGLSSGVDQTDLPLRYYSVETLTRNFYALSLAFSLNHGCVTACLDYASALLGNRLGSVSSGVLFASYAVASFLVSKPIVTMIGAKKGLICGVIGYCIYVCGFLLSTLSISVAPNFAWLLSIVTSLIGGVAGGLLWTSQGLYFSRHSQLYSNATAQEIDKISADFSAIFAVIFLGLEMVAKLGASILFSVFGYGGLYAVVLLYTSAVVGSCFVVLTIKSLDIKGNGDISYRSISREAGAVARLAWKDKRLTMLLPFQLAFGFTSAFIPYYIFGTVVVNSPHLGIRAVGVLSSLIVLVGALSAIPAAYMSNMVGKPYVIVIGGACITIVGLFIFALSDQGLGIWMTMIPLVSVYGLGRGVWETINKAVFVDFFSDDIDKCAAAFSAATFANGYAAGMGFLAFSFMRREEMAFLIVITSIAALVSYMYAFKMQDQRKEIERYNAQAQAQVDAIRDAGQQSRRVKERTAELKSAVSNSSGNGGLTSADGYTPGFSSKVGKSIYANSPEKSPLRHDGIIGTSDSDAAAYAASLDQTKQANKAKQQAAAPQLPQFSIGQGGISLISGRGGSTDDLLAPFTNFGKKKDKAKGADKVHRQAEDMAKAAADKIHKRDSEGSLNSNTDQDIENNNALKEGGQESMSAVQEEVGMSLDEDDEEEKQLSAAL